MQERTAGRRAAGSGRVPYQVGRVIGRRQGAHEDPRVGRHDQHLFCKATRAAWLASQCPMPQVDGRRAVSADLLTVQVPSEGSHGGCAVDDDGRGQSVRGVVAWRGRRSAWAESWAEAGREVLEV